MNDDLRRRARDVAIGLADTGISQAEEMLRRVSPEGRARARRIAAQRARRRNAVMGRVAIAVLVAALVLAGAGSVAPPLVALALSIAVLVTLATVLIRRLEPAQIDPVHLAASDLPALPARTGAWLDAQRPALPAPAVRLADQLQHRLDGLAPQLAQLAPDEPAGDAVRKLLATELPHLLDRYQAVPPSLRNQPRPDGRTADAHLLDGLQLIDQEVARMTEQLARGALDEVATQGRYLELKYRGD